MGKRGRERAGGIHQRLQAIQREEEQGVIENPDYVAQSVLAQFLLTMFTWGEFSPQRVQHLAQLALSDLRAAQTNKAVVDDLSVLANIGSGGKYANKMHVDLLKKTQHISRLPEPFNFKTTFQEPHGEQSQTMMLPHEMFAAIAEDYRPTWHRSICPGQNKLQEFWDTAQNHPLMVDHPVRERNDWASWCIPFGLHGDGVPVVGIGKAWSKVLNVFSWFSLVGTGNTRSKMFYCYSAFDKISKPGFPHGSLQEPFLILQWSFYWLFRGQWPDRDHHGNMLLLQTWFQSFRCFSLPQTTHKSSCFSTSTITFLNNFYLVYM